MPRHISLVSQLPPEAGEFPAVLQEMLLTRQSYGRSGKVISVSAISTFNNLVTLRRLHLDLEPRRTLEVGFFQGGSCLVFTQTFKDLGAIPSRQHLAIDPYQRRPWIDEGGLCNVEKAGLSEFLDFREQKSNVVLPLLLSEGEQFGIIYIDGSHTFEDAFVDVYYAAQLIEFGGVILIDDCAFNQVQKVVRFVRRNLRSSFKEFELTPYRPVRGLWGDLIYGAARMAKKNQLIAFQRVGDPVREWDSVYRDF